MVFVDHPFLPSITYFRKPIASTNIAPVMSSRWHPIKTIRTSHPSGSRLNHILCCSALGTSVPLTIFGTEPCPKIITESMAHYYCPDPKKLTARAKRQTRWPTEASNQTRWFYQTPCWFTSVAQTLTWEHQFGSIRPLVF